MVRIIFSLLVTILVVAACAADPASRAVVTGAAPELLKLRAGPGLGYRVIVGLPDGTQLTRRGCVTEVGQLWCRVSLDANPTISGYVAAHYLANR